MHKFYYELTNYCNKRDLLINNIRSYKSSINLIEENLLNFNNPSLSDHRCNLRAQYAIAVNKFINDLKKNEDTIKIHLLREPIRVAEKSEEELNQMKCILKRAKEDISQDLLMYY